MRYLPLPPRLLFAGLAGLALLLVGCQANVPGLGLLKSAKFTPGGPAEVVVKPEVVSERKLLAMAPPALRPEHVHHIVIALYHLEDDPLATEPIEVEVASRSVDNVTFGQDGFTLAEEDFTFNHLHADTEYRIRGFAYDAPGFSAIDLISTVDAQSKVDFTTDNNDAPQAVGIPIQLKDTPFDAVARAGGVNVESGDIIPYGFVDRIAGSIMGAPNGDPNPEMDQFATPTAVAIDQDNGDVWVADSANHAVRRLSDNRSGNFAPVSLVIGFNGGAGFQSVPTPRASANVEQPSGLAFGNGGKLYIADTGNNCIRVLDRDTDTVSVLAGAGPATPGFDDGTGAGATFNKPRGLAFDYETGMLFVADTGNHAIRVVNPASGAVTTLAGQGVPNLVNHATDRTQVGFNKPIGLLIGGTTVIVADSGNHRIRTVKFRLEAGEVVFDGSGTLAGQNQGSGDGVGTGASFNRPSGITSDRNRNLYVLDTGNHRIRKIVLDNLGNATVSTWVGNLPGQSDGVRNTAQFLEPEGIAFDPIKGRLIVADTQNHRIRLVD